jgi:hypothetical protein
MAMVRALQTFFLGSPSGVPVKVAAGDVFDAASPVVRGREALFEPVEGAVARSVEVEQATAAPGERRNVIRKRGV